MTDWHKLRKKYPIFEYQSFHWEKAGNDLFCSWVMKAGELTFHPTVLVKGAGDKIGNLTVGELDNLVFHLGLADIFSYWKATCSPKILITAGHLDQSQINWWHDLLISGMGQYFYENAIDFRAKNFLKISSKSERQTRFAQDSVKKNEQVGLNRILVPVGGGKDSAVTLDLLIKHFGAEKVGAFAMNLARAEDLLPAARRIVQTAGVPELIAVRRTLDPQVFTLKNKGYLDGHIPFTAYLSFLSILVARLFGYSTIAFSNERSANEGNVDYLGKTVNHQYSKSFEFEEKFRDYNKRYLSSLSYFSFLRPLFELQIMKIFGQPQMSNYYAHFRSCNIGYKNDSWCGECPKCLAVYVGLLPFVSEKALQKIFKHNLLNNPKLLTLTKNILGEGEGKPFECIGTFQETVVAFHLARKKFPGKRLPILLKFYQESVLPKYPDIEKMTKEILTAWDSHNNLPKEYTVLLKENYGSK